jgi:hypothetical protein
MINFLQLNQNLTEWNTSIIHSGIWQFLHNMLQSNETNIEEILRYIHNISIQYNMDKKQIILSYFDYIIRSIPHILSIEFLNIMEDCLHNYDADIENLIEYFYYKLSKYYAGK